MTEPKAPAETPPDLNQGKAVEMVGVGAGDAAAPAAGPVPANQLTPEEQMALFEKELKENDWGHQPC
jgi:hypothetical protein